MVIPMGAMDDDPDEKGLVKKKKHNFSYKRSIT